MTPTGVPQGKKRKILPLVLGVAAGLGLAAGGVVGLTYALFSGEDSRAQAEEPSATLPESAEAAVAAPPPDPTLVGAADPGDEPVQMEVGDVQVSAGPADDEPASEAIADADEATEEEAEDDSAARRTRRGRGARRAGRRGRALAASGGGGSGSASGGEQASQGASSQGGSGQGSTGTPSRGSTGRSGPTKIIRSANF